MKTQNNVSARQFNQLVEAALEAGSEMNKIPSAVRKTQDQKNAHKFVIEKLDETYTQLCNAIVDAPVGKNGYVHITDRAASIGSKVRVRKLYIRGVFRAWAVRSESGKWWLREVFTVDEAKKIGNQEPTWFGVRPTINPRKP